MERSIKATIASFEKSIELQKEIKDEYLGANDKFETECSIVDFTRALKALKKEEPFKPTACSVTLGRCKCGVGFLDKTTNYCGNCGQRLDWSEYDRSEKINK